MAEVIKEISEVQNVPTGDTEDWYRGDGYHITTDKQVIKLLINNGQSCCENWGYFMSEDDTKSFIGADLLELTITDTVLNTHSVPEGLKDDDGVIRMYDGGIMFVNISTSKGLLQFVAYNEHNGYYGHTAYVISEQLTHQEGL